MAVLVDLVAERELSAADYMAPAQSTTRILETLESLGYEPVQVGLEPEERRDWLARLISDDFLLAFNLCEGIGGYAAAEHLPAAAVELLGIPMTGATSRTLMHCLHKDLTSAMLQAHGIPVPRWRGVREEEADLTWATYPAIVKPAAEDASNGIHPNSVVNAPDELEGAVERLRQHWGDLIIQEYIDGREINVAIVGETVLPIAEIDFSDLPAGSPRIVSFAAKWIPESPDYAGTRPICPAPLDPDVAERVREIACAAWRLMGGTGYARVDFRVDERGRPHVIEINPNPDLSTDAGLARQALVSGWSYEELIARIVDDALSRRSVDTALGDASGGSSPSAATERTTRRAV